MFAALKFLIVFATVNIQCVPTPHMFVARGVRVPAPFARWRADDGPSKTHTIDETTSAGAYQEFPGDGEYQELDILEVDCYAFRTVEGERVYSPTGAHWLVEVSQGNCALQFAANAVAGAEGYRWIRKFETAAFTKHQDTIDPELGDVAHANWLTGATVTPDSITGPCEDGETLESWQDVIGETHLGQMLANGLPIWSETGGPGGAFPAVVFDNDYLEAAIAGQSGGTELIVFKVNTVQQQRIIGDNNRSAMTIFGVTGAPNRFLASGSQSIVDGTANSAWRMAVVRYSTSPLGETPAIYLSGGRYSGVVGVTNSTLVTFGQNGVATKFSAAWRERWTHNLTEAQIVKRAAQVAAIIGGGLATISITPALPLYNYMSFDAGVERLKWDDDNDFVWDF